MLHPGSRVEAEMEAYDALRTFLVQAQDVAEKFRLAGLAIPAPIARLFGEETSDERRSSSVLTIPPPSAPARPSAAKPDWLWVRLQDLSPTSLVLGILRTQPGPLPAPEIVALTRSYKPAINQGTVYNLGLRLKGDKIEVTDEGWRLKDPASAPVFNEGYAWGPASVFQQFDVAWFRREMLLHVLRSAQPDGLMAMQIVRHMQQLRNPKAPTNKTLIKVDLDTLKGEDKVKQIGNSKKWTVTGKGGAA